MKRLSAVLLAFLFCSCGNENILPINRPGELNAQNIPDHAPRHGILGDAGKSAENNKNHISNQLTLDDFTCSGNSVACEINSIRNAFKNKIWTAYYWDFFSEEEFNSNHVTGFQLIPKNNTLTYKVFTRTDCDMYSTGRILSENVPYTIFSPGGNTIYLDFGNVRFEIICASQYSIEFEDRQSFANYRYYDENAIVKSNINRCDLTLSTSGM